MKLTKFNIDEEVIKQVIQPLDKRLILQRDGGNKKILNYISGNTCIDLLNNAFNYAWSFKVISYEIIKADNYIKKENAKYPFNSKNSNVDLIKTDAENKKYLEIENQGSIAWVLGELTVPFKNKDTGEVVYITKSGFGSQLISGNGQTQSMTGLKAAATDALKKAATQFGIALELYRTPEEQDFFDNISKPIIWTKEVIEQNKELWDKYQGIKEECGWTDNDTAYFVNKVTNEYTKDVYKMPVELMSKLLQEMMDYEY